ncbi:hypothetical protein Cgig2_004638 [Carnegiea gigantea]|uniref:Uncharacterized protein n=1 Tax=Carnegiea gigantea TaxID=171969 RepID=A0A9Q1K1D4_9CARY|nr:hypothetical protein Cgig2_004638 [Carnegiea gigantea]
MNNGRHFEKLKPFLVNLIVHNCAINYWKRNWIRMDKDAKNRLLDKIKRYRLKEEHFARKTITQAISKRPSEVHKEQWHWLVNHWADPKQQVFYDHSSSKGSIRHKDGSWDPEAAAKYEEFKELHMSQIEKEGADNLSLKEAYLLVMKEKSGWPCPQPPRKGRATEVMRVEVAAEIQQL